MPLRTEPRRAKRILLLVTQADWGGVQSFLVRFAEALMKDGREVLLAAGGEGELWREASARGIPTKRLQHMVREISPMEDAKAFFEIKKLIDQFRPDAIHLNSSKMGAVGSLAASWSKTKPWTVYRIGGWSFLDPNPSWKQKLLLETERFTAKHKDVIVTVHRGDKELEVRHGIRPRVFSKTVPNGLDVPSFITKILPRGEARRSLGIPEHAFVFGTIANAYATKGLLAYLDVLERELVEDQHAFGVIIGDGPEFEELKRKRESLTAKDRIILTGHRDDASKYLGAFDTFVLPSRKEGMPWTILEAMAAGVPVVATDVGACKWMLREGSHGNAGIIVPKEDPLSLHEALRRIRTRPEDREAFANTGRRDAQERFSWTKTLERQIDLLDQRLG